jgi:hypothetical protein
VVALHLQSSVTTAVRPRLGVPVIADRFGLFTFLLAFGYITHHHPGSLTSDWDTPFVPLALGLSLVMLLRPGSVVVFVGLLVATVLDFWSESPFFTNHYLLLALLALVLLPLVLSVARAADRSVLERRVFAVSAAGLLATYVLAAFQKMNDGFLDPVLGCAVSHYNLFAETVELPRIGGGLLGHTLAWGTIAVELAIPGLLLFRRTRLAGLALGIVFHYAMAANGHAAFSAIALALYVPFLPEDIVPALGRQAERSRWAGYVLPSFAVVGIAQVVVGTALHLADVQVGSSLTARVPYLLLAPGLVVLVAHALPDTSRPASLLPTGDVPTLLGIGVTLAALLLVTSLPYLGVRTQGTLSMFSNLRSEASVGYWNHLLVPEAVQVVDRYDTWIQLVDSEPSIQFRTLGADEQVHAVNEFELRRAVADRCRGTETVALQYRELGTGRLVVLDDACDSELGRHAGLVERKLVWFRPIAEPNACQH